MQSVLPYNWDKPIPWENVIPKEKYQEIQLSHEKQVNSILLEIGDDIDYLNYYSKTSSVFGYLQPVKINKVKLKAHLFTGEHKLFLSDIQPDKNGFLPVPQYNLCDTVTGRMKITSGPNILLLPKKLRDIFDSRFGDEGSLWYLDFTSLEPRVILAIKNYLLNPSLIGNPPQHGIIEESFEQIPKDIYTDALKKMKLSNEITRDTLKQIVLPQLYGQAKSLTIENLEHQGVRGPDEVVEMVNDFFGIDGMRNYVNSEYEKTSHKFLRTFLGRHLSPDDSKPHALLNYFIQSTAVDLALLGFERICRKLAEIPTSKEVIVPVFVLHDALILDVHNKASHILEKLCQIGSKNDIPGLSHQMFHITSSKI